MKKIGVLTVLFCLVVFAGCDGAKETISQMRAELKQDILNEESNNSPKIQEKADDDSENTAPKMPDAEDITIEETYRSVQTVAQANVEEMTISLYFASADGKGLVKQEKKIPKAEGKARATIEALLNGPEEESGLLSAIPQGTKLRDINIKPEDKLCIIDLSEEFKQVKNTAAADLAVYALVDTLCQFDTVDKVEIRIEGENVSSIGGQINLRETVKAKYDLVK